MIVLTPVSLTLGTRGGCSLSVLDGHPRTRSTLWQAAPLHFHVCRVELGNWLHLLQPLEGHSNPEDMSMQAAPRGECGARRVMDAATLWPTVDSLFIPSHRQVQTWDRLAKSQPHGSVQRPWPAATGMAPHLAGARVLMTTSGSSSSTTGCTDQTAAPDSLTQCVATPGWLLAYLLHWSPKRIRKGPREKAAMILSALIRSSTSGRLEWASSGKIVQVQDGHIIDWGPFTQVAGLLSQLAQRDADWLDCRPPWSLSSALWLVAGSLLAVGRPMDSSSRIAMKDFVDWAVCQVSSSLDSWARSPRGPARDLDQLVMVRPRGLRARLPVDLLHSLSTRKNPRATLDEWKASGLTGGCNTAHLARRRNNMYLTKGQLTLSQAITLNLTLDATQAGGNSLEVCVAWGVEVQTCAYAPPQAESGAGNCTD